MTREEEISDIISLMDYMKYEWMGSDVPEALETAIEALKQPEIRYCEDCMYYGRDIGHCYMHGMTTDPGDYCSYSVRRREE